MSTVSLPQPVSHPRYRSLRRLQEDEWLLIVWHQDRAAIEILPEALGHLLATTPAPRSALITTACALGADADEANEIIDDLIADGVLCEETGARSTHD